MNRRQRNKSEGGRNQPSGLEDRRQESEDKTGQGSKWGAKLAEMGGEYKARQNFLQREYGSGRTL